MKEFVDKNKVILMEAAVVERLRRSNDIALHPLLVHAPLIYDEKGREALKKIYQEYIQIASAADLPVLLCSPTWRANKERVTVSKINESINIDSVKFLQTIRENSTNKSNIKIGGLLGCKNDCYKPEQGLSASEAEEFHDWQVSQLAIAQPDFLIAETLPYVKEAIGIAKACEKTQLPYIISFVINRESRVLDGTLLMDAIDEIDASVQAQPLGYMVNCAYPEFLQASSQPKRLFKRLIGYQANASALDHAELDNCDTLQTESITDWGEEMLRLNQDFGLKILGGCCGTSGEHLRYLTKHLCSTCE